MSNLFKISEDADLSFEDEDYLDSIDLEALTSKALQAKSSRDQTALLKPMCTSGTQQVNNGAHKSKQFQAYTGQESSPAGNRATTNASPTHHTNTKKFTFKFKKSPECGQTPLYKSRAVLSPIQAAPTIYSTSTNTRVPSAVATSAIPSNDRTISHAQGLMCTTPNLSSRLRTPNFQSLTEHTVQPPMSVTVKRDGTDIRAVGHHTTFNPAKVCGGSALMDCSKPPTQSRSASQFDSEVQNLKFSSHLVDNQVCGNNGRSNRSSSEFISNQTTKIDKYFKKYVPPEEEKSNNTQLRSTPVNQVKSTPSQLRNPSQSFTINPAKCTPVNEGVFPPSSASSVSVSQVVLKPNHSCDQVLPNQAQKCFIKNHNTVAPSIQNLPKLTANSLQSNSVYNTPRQNAQLQARNASPLQASTPGYRSPSPGGNGCQRGVSPIQQRYPATPKTGGNIFGTTGSEAIRSHRNRHTNTPHVPQLTPRVAQLCQTPSKHGNRNTIRTRARTFPGPAGVLPKLVRGQTLDDVLLEDASTEKILNPPSANDSSVHSTISTQDVGVDEFERGAWLTMKTDLGECAKSILITYNIATVLRKASLKQLPRNKVPNLCVMIRNVTHNGCDACVSLKDTSGEMQGTLHRKIVEDYQSNLKPGSVMVLRKVGVLSPSIRNHYLNITPSNLVQVYPVESCSTPCSQTSPKMQRKVSGINRSPENSKALELANKLCNETIPNRVNTSKVSDNSISPAVDFNNKQREPHRNFDQLLHVSDSGALDTTKQPQTKTLQIEGFNTPESVHNVTRVNKWQPSVEGHAELVKKERRSKILLVKGIDLQPDKETQNEISQLQAKDSGIHLDQSRLSRLEIDKSHPVEAYKPNEQNKTNMGSGLSCLRKQSVLEKDKTKTLSECIVSVESPSKRMCLETSKTSVEKAEKLEDNFDFLLEGIENEIFNDF